MHFRHDDTNLPTDVWKLDVADRRRWVYAHNEAYDACMSVEDNDQACRIKAVEVANADVFGEGPAEPETEVVIIVGPDASSKISVHARHSRTKCMLCDNPPEIDVLWADGMGRAWFCESCYAKWKKEYPVEVVDERKVKDEVSIHWGDITKSNSMRTFTINEMSRIRFEVVNGTRYLIAPVILIKAGVLNEELVPANEVTAHYAAWNGRPFIVGHPRQRGMDVSVNDPELLSKMQIGQLFNVDKDGGKLKGEIWIDPSLASQVDRGDEVVERLVNGRPLEVSTAYFRDKEVRSGVFDGKRFASVAHNLRPDHLAALLDVPGACSWKDGCGAPRVNEDHSNDAMVAFTLPEKISNKLELDPNQDLHLTLVYLGKLDSLDKDVVIDTIKKFALSNAPIRGCINGIGRFANREPGGASAFYANFDSPVLPTFRHDLVEALVNAGIKFPQDHGFTPHITLTYLKPGQRLPLENLLVDGVVFDELTLALGNKHSKYKLSGVASNALDFTPPKPVQDAAKRGLELYESGYGGAGLEQETIDWARKVAAGKPIDQDKAEQGYKWHKRNARFEDFGDTTPAGTAWWLWFGKAGKKWFEGLWDQLNASQNSMSHNISVKDINSATIRKEDDAALLNIHKHLHGLWARNFAGTDVNSVDGLTREDLVNAHVVVRDEMAKRRMQHAAYPRDELDDETCKLAGPFRIQLLTVMDDTVVIPDMVTVTGSVAEAKPHPDDMDVLIRAERITHGGSPGFFIRAQNLELPVRKRVDPEKAGLHLHWNENPQGPHASYITLADLVLRWRNPAKRISVNQEMDLNLDLGCGNNVEPGFVGIDANPESHADVICDVVSQGIPYPNDSASIIRAFHFLEDVRPEDRVGIMREIWRVLKPSGKFQFEVPRVDSAGAEMPFHLSHWSEQTFHAFHDPDLVDAYKLPPFRIIKLDTITFEDGRINVRGEMLPIKAGDWSAVESQEYVDANAIPVITMPVFPKPSDKFFTDHFSPDELWNSWGVRHSPMFAEVKYNGFRAMLQKKGNRVTLVYEDSPGNRISKFPDLLAAARRVKNDFILDVNLGVKDAKGYWPRIKLMTLTATKPVIPRGAYAEIRVFDVPYWDDDLTSKPFSERRKVLEKIAGLFKGTKLINISSGMQVDSSEKLRKAYDRYGRQNGSEGLVVKDVSSCYPWGKTSTSDWSKIKNVLEIKARVLEVKETDDERYNFRGGLALGQSSYANITDGYVDLGFSFNSSFKANVGDVVTFEVEEIILNADDTLSWLGAKPMDVDTGRKTPYAADQVVDMAARAGVLQDVRVSTQNLDEKLTRGDVAEKDWGANWDDLVERGEGKFILHGHFPSLTEEESKLGLGELLAMDNQYHTDLRMEAPSPHGAWGFTCYEGKSSEVPKSGSRLDAMPADKPMRGSFKLEQPKQWLEFAKDKPQVTETVGRVGKDAAKFFALDYGTYKLTYAREHAFEVILNGAKGVADGRYIMAYVPVEGGERIWMISRPANQATTFPQEHKLETVVKEMEGRRWLFWRDTPDAKLEKIDARKGVIESKQASMICSDMCVRSVPTKNLLVEGKMEKGEMVAQILEAIEAQGLDMELNQEDLEALGDEVLNALSKLLVELAERGKAKESQGYGYPPPAEAESQTVQESQEPQGTQEATVNADCGSLDELSAFAKAVKSRGGLEAVLSAFDAIKANEEKRKTDLVSMLASNASCAFTKKQLEGMDIDALVALQRTLSPADFSGQGGGPETLKQETVVELPALFGK